MRGVFGHYLPPEGIGNLHKYAYVSGHRTPFDRLMNPWWEAAERVVPRTIHPNALTVSSCITAIIGCSLLLCFCPYLAEHPPRWVFLVSAALFFLYQTLDAIDGKHARRHRLSSPLGQLMDHGCDIICTTPLTLLGTAIIGGGVGLRQYAVLVVSSQLIQFLYTWWELHFGVFYTATGIIGVTEAQLTIILLSIIGGTFGPEVYHVNLLQYLPLSVGAPLAKLAAAAGVDVTPSVLFQLLLLACNISICILNIVMGLKRAPRFCVAFTQVVMFLVYIFFQGLVYMHVNIFFAFKRNAKGVLLLSSAFIAGLVWRPVLNPYLIYTAICSTYAILLLRLCLSATCRFPYKLVQWPMLPLAAVAAALLLGDLTADQELWAILAVCIFNCIYLADFVYTVVSDVCDGLNTRCFSVPKLGTAQTPSEQPKKAD